MTAVPFWVLDNAVASKNSSGVWLRSFEHCEVAMDQRSNKYSITAYHQHHWQSSATAAADGSSVVEGLAADLVVFSNV